MDRLFRGVRGVYWSFIGRLLVVYWSFIGCFMGFMGVTLLYSRSQHLTVLSSEQEKR